MRDPVKVRGRCTAALTLQFESLLTAFMSHIFVSVLPRTSHRSVAIALAR